MSKTPTETIEQYEKLLKKEPKSKVFAALADAYRDQGRHEEAERIAREGLNLHPQYVGGYLALSRVLMESGRIEEAETSLRKAVDLSPENLLAYQLLGQCYVDLKRPQDALRAHKMVLFLNPLSEKSRVAVEKLETLSATDYDDDLFEMRPLKSTTAQPKPIPHAKENNQSRPQQQDQVSTLLKGDVERELSYIDALIVRNQMEKAREILHDLSQEYPDNEEVLKRWAFFEEDEPGVGEQLEPLYGREQRIWRRKVSLLEGILANIEKQRQILS